MDLETLTATLVGGVLSLLGSVYVARRENRRAAQIRLFDEFLPQFEPEPPVLMISGGAPQERRSVNFYSNAAGRYEVLPLMHRTARLAGRKTALLVKALEDARGPLVRDLDEEEARYVFEPVDLEEADDDEALFRQVCEGTDRLRASRNEEFQRLCAARTELLRHLEKKLGMRGWRTRCRLNEKKSVAGP
jgi:hypothetical protein